MNIRRYRAHLGKILLLAFWGMCILGIYAFLDYYNIPVRRLPALIRLEAMNAGSLGPLVILLTYIAVTIIPFPTAALAVVVGSLYGPVYGSLFVWFCANTASVASFYLGRYFGRHLLSEHEHGWIKKFDAMMHENGFTTVLIMRILYFPFELVSMGSGMSRISFREYMIASLLGSAPGTITFVVLGNAFTHPRSWILFGCTLSISLILAFLLRHSRWTRRFLFKKVEPNIFE